MVAVVTILTSQEKLQIVFGLMSRKIDCDYGVAKTTIPATKMGNTL